MSVTGVGSDGVSIGSVPVVSNSPVRWSDIVVEHDKYLEETRDKSLVFIGDGYENSGLIKTVAYTHRWKVAYTKMQYAKMNDFVRGAASEYDDPYIVVLPGLTASTTDERGEPRPPIDHFNQLKRSWSRGVRYELKHVMDADREKDRYPAREWEYLQVWEPTTDAGYTEGGYAHCHPVIVCDGKVEKERFRSVLQKHVDKAEWAKMDAHDLSETNIQRLDEFTNPAAYLFKYLSKSWNHSDAEPYQRRFDALLYETGYRRWQPSDGSQRWMQLEDSGSKEPWMFAGVADPGQRDHLADYTDVDEFQVSHEMGVVSYLAGYGPHASVSVDECSHQFERGECVECGVSARVWWNGSVVGGSPRPPPSG